MQSWRTTIDVISDEIVLSESNGYRIDAIVRFTTDSIGPTKLGRCVNGGGFALSRASRMNQEYSYRQLGFFARAHLHPNKRNREREINRTQNSADPHADLVLLPSTFFTLRIFESPLLTKEKHPKLNSYYH